MTDVETDAIVDDTDVQPTAARTRRGVFGRLYHGETAIDFYGRRHKLGSVRRNRVQPRRG